MSESDIDTDRMMLGIDDSNATSVSLTDLEKHGLELYGLDVNWENSVVANMFLRGMRYSLEHNEPIKRITDLKAMYLNSVEERLLLQSKLDSGVRVLIVPQNDKSYIAYFGDDTEWEKKHNATLIFDNDNQD